MFLRDLYEDTEVPDNRYDAKADKTANKPRHTRKVRLTLEQINKLRRMNQVRKVEQAEQEKFFQVIYGTPPEQPSM